MRFMCYVDGSGDRNLGFSGSGTLGNLSFSASSSCDNPPSVYGTGLGQVCQGHIIQGTHRLRTESPWPHRHGIHRFVDRPV
jgi:hypothetical protein